jgi:hypothetical protein
MARFRNVIGGILIGLTVALCTTVGPAAAKEVLLTQDNVTRFLDTFKEMRDIAVTEGLKTGMDSNFQKNPIGAVLKAIKSSKLKTDAEKIAVKHGFADLKDWSGTGRSIAQAYLYINTGPARGIARETLDKNKDRAISELDKLGILTDKSKQKLKEGLDDISEALASEPPEQNTAVVKEMMPKIEDAVKSGVE